MNMNIMLRTIGGAARIVGQGVRAALVATVAVSVAVTGVAIADYAMTQGTGTNFASIDIASVKHAVSIMCDATLGEATCAKFRAGNTALTTDVALVVVDPNVLAAVNAPIPACGANPCTNAIGVVDQRSQYPAGAIAITASATGTTAATTATLAGAGSKTTYLCGYSIRANATAAVTGNATVTGTITGTLNFTQWTAPLASGLGINEQVFFPCVPASAVNTAIAIISAAPGTGGVVSSTAWGYQL